MSALAALKLVVSKKNRAVSPVMHKRQKLCAKLTEQIALCEAEQAGEIYAPKRLKSVVDAATGERTVVATTKRVREWFWRENGKYNLAIKYGANCCPEGSFAAKTKEKTYQSTRLVSIGLSRVQPIPITLRLYRRVSSRPTSKRINWVYFIMA